MQRSRKSLLRRKADSEKEGITGRKNLYYKVSLSLLLLSWGLIFLNSLTRRGNGYEDEKYSVDGESHWHEALPGIYKSSLLDVIPSPPYVGSDRDVQKTHASAKETVGQKEENLVPETNKVTSTNAKEQADEEAINVSPLKSERLSRVAPSGLDEFKSRAVQAKEKSKSSQSSAVIHRVEPGGKEYNYASSTKGAKVLDCNKEAKGASNILDKDKDKYLRNPCSAEEKYVVIELSEETLVDTIELANFEHYSSNVKDFQLLSSLVYPTDTWDELGNFTAQNAKHAQRFTLPEPKWARYLKLNLTSHYGTEFYCTLSVLEVFGVDVVEKMLEDLILVEDKRGEANEQIKEHVPMQEPTKGDDINHEPLEIHNEAPHELPNINKDVVKKTVPDPVLETRQVGRVPGDTVLKILLQKVQSLDINFSVLERYLEELNNRYAHTFKEFDNEMVNKDIILDKIKSQIKELQNSKDTFAEDVAELLLWKSLVSSQLDTLVKDNEKIRLDFEKVRDHQTDKEKRGLVVIFISFFFGCLAAAKLFIGLLFSLLRIQTQVEFCKDDSAWFFFLLSSSFIAVIMVL